MNVFQKAALDGLINRLNAFIEKVAAENKIEKTKIVILYWENNLYYQLPGAKSVLIDTETL